MFIINQLMCDLIRNYPSKKKEFDLIKYPIRTNMLDVDDIFKLSNSIKYNNDYKKWEKGINYNSKSNNKVIIGGKIHNNLGNKFMINHYDNNTNIKMGYKDVIQYDWNFYKLKTKLLCEDIDKQNINIVNLNKEIINYNILVDDIINEINKLEKWNDYIEFDNNKYGVPVIIKNKIHIENDCNGNIIKYYFKKCECNKCENWYGCGIDGYQYYKCDKCNYKNYKQIKSDNYKSHW